MIMTVSLIAWHYAIQKSQIYLASIHNKLKSADIALSEMNANSGKNFPLVAIMNPLMIIRQLMEELNNSHINKFISGTKFRNSIISTHDQLADKYLLPQIMRSLEINLRLEGTDDDSLNHLFDTLALYLNLSGRLSLAAEEQQQLLESVFQNLEPEFTPRAQLIREFLRIFRSGRPNITPDNSLIEQAQSRLAKLSQASRALYILAENSSIPRWRAADIIGPDADEIILIDLPASNSCSISGLYTRAGFETVVIPRFSDALQKVISSRQVWANPDKTDITDLGRDTLISYAGRFNQIWANYLQHINLQLPDHTVTTNEGLLQTRHSYNARLRKLLTNIADQTNLSPHLAKPDSQFALASSMSLWQEQIPYAHLRTFLNSNKSPETEQSLLDQLFTTLDLIEKYTYRLSLSEGASDASASIESKLLEQYQKLRDMTPDLPAPLRQWIEQFTESSGPALRTAIGQSLGELWNKQNYSICKKLIANRYPFKRAASTDISMEDFTQLFGPDGIFARFTNESLKPYIETDSLPWHWRQQDLAASFSQNSLEMFEQADRIRRSFFLSGSKKPDVTVNIKAQNLPADIQAAIMQIEGLSVTGTPQQKDVVSVNWPADGSNRTSKLVVFTDSWREIASASGPWSFFRLLDKGKIKQESTGQFQITFNAQGKPVSFLADFSALFPAYNKALLEGFQCKTIS
jgi:type VI secretion system protein ImpL